MTHLPVAQPSFLGVDCSFTGRRWRARLDAFGEARALALVQRDGIGDHLARILTGRDIPPESISTYLAPTVRALMPDPSRLRGLDEAVERLSRAIVADETIAIFGDYDVDGAASAALLASYLDTCGVPRRIHIPDRITEGYGPNIEAIRALKADGASLLVCVDCGTTSHEALAEAKAMGLDAVVIDHHLAPPDLPDAIVVNPNRQDCLSGLGYLCAAGVAFMVLAGLNRHLRAEGFWSPQRPEPSLLDDLDLVALATVADVAPLTGLNRAFVARGLEAMARRSRLGLAALADAARLNGPPEAWHLGFALGPRINAGGRIGDAALGARLLLERDSTEAGRIAAELDRLNEERRVIERATVDAALTAAFARFGDAPPAVVMATGEGWHPGVVGLVAARLKERFNRPAFAISLGGETGTGSGRSIPGVDLGGAVRAAVDADLLIKGGGHPMAAGITVRGEGLAALEAFLAERLAPSVAIALRDDALRIDGALSAGGLTRDLMADIERAGPFGAGNPQPVFVLPAHVLTHVAQVGEQHLRLHLQARDGARIEAMAFRAAETALGEALRPRRGEMLHVAVALSVDRWGGRERVAARIVDAAPAQ